MEIAPKETGDMQLKMQFRNLDKGVIDSVQHAIEKICAEHNVLCELSEGPPFEKYVKACE